MVLDLVLNVFEWPLNGFRHGFSALLAGFEIDLVAYRLFLDAFST